MIILAPIEKKSNGLLFQTKVLDLATIKAGDSMFLNMTTLKIGIELGQANILIEPGQIKTHNPLGGSKAVSLPVRLSYFHPERAEWAMITASTAALARPDANCVSSTGTSASNVWIARASPCR